MRVIQSFARNQQGATAVEYSLIAGMIFLALVAGVRLVGGSTSNLFNNVSTQWSNAAS